MLTGIVSSKNMEKTGKVAIHSIKKHKLYKKYMKREKNIFFHDENNECQVGDKVMIAECRPISKMKRYRLVKVLERPTA
jgi:small subunit ribosomal protein S17